MSKSQNYSSSHAHRSSSLSPSFGLSISIVSLLSFSYCESFIPSKTIERSSQSQLLSPITSNSIIDKRKKSVSALNVWFFGGSDNESEHNDESCELVPIRIERTSANSRKIAGEITVPTPLEDVWAILTDYDRLAVHVPNLVQSKIVSSSSPGEQGDGEYTCRLYQQGAQKIVGFQFGADVTMDMKEKVIVGPPSSEIAGTPPYPEQRQISFKCVDSFFFKNFDGTWMASEVVDETGQILTKLAYAVDVRPKGPVPVAALEWRIREDVPTNLRAVKKAALDVGEVGVMATRRSRKALTQSVRRVLVREGANSWEEEETMAAYLNDAP